jgi:hypothetical protein
MSLPRSGGTFAVSRSCGVAPEKGRPVVNYPALSSGGTMGHLLPACSSAGHAQVGVHASKS